MKKSDLFIGSDGELTEEEKQAKLSKLLDGKVSTPELDKQAVELKRKLWPERETDDG